jgi:hypothetical protein
MTNPHPTRVGRGYYAPGRRDTSLGADLTVAVPGGITAAARGIPDWLAFVGVLAVAGGALYLGTRLGGVSSATGSLSA